MSQDAYIGIADEKDLLAELSRLASDEAGLKERGLGSLLLEASEGAGNRIIMEYVEAFGEIRTGSSQDFLASMGKVEKYGLGKEESLFAKISKSLNGRGVLGQNENLAEYTDKECKGLIFLNGDDSREAAETMCQVAKGWESLLIKTVLRGKYRVEVEKVGKVDEKFAAMRGDLKVTFDPSKKMVVAAKQIGIAKYVTIELFPCESYEEYGKSLIFAMCENVLKAKILSDGKKAVPESAYAKVRKFLDEGADYMIISAMEEICHKCKACGNPVVWYYEPQ
jgi:hypothetical protein